MKSLADGLPPEIAAQIHPDWRKNEAEYWAVRDALLEQYRDHWIAFADGSVVASDRSPLAVAISAQAVTDQPFVTCVGRERETIRIRSRYRSVRLVERVLRDIEITRQEAVT